MVSLDGFRHDYVKKFNPPHLSKLIKEGASAQSVIPVYPSKTFPNHYSIVTGMYANKHGLIDNPFYDTEIEAVYSSSNREVSLDPKWYGGTPLWQLAQGQGLKTASFFWVGSELPIKGQYPTYHKKYDPAIPNQERIDQTVAWLSLPEAERPRLITLYFSLVDDAGHRYGPDSPEVKQAVLQADSLVGKLQNALKNIALPITLLIVSDHGMEQINPVQEYFVNLEKIADLRDTTINFFSNAVHTQFYFKDKTKIDKAYQDLKKNEKNYTVFLRKDIPKHWHYNLPTRTGDMLVVAKPPYLIGGNHAEKKMYKEQTRGQHGYDPYTYKNMHAIFYAWGAHIKPNFALPTFEIVHIYPLVAHLLGLDIPKDIDGKLKVLKKILKK